jgi:hypothetical protein
MDERDEQRTSAAPQLSLITTLCGNGTCPTVYRTDRGTLVVQGKLIAAETVGIDLPAGEVLVEIPEELMAGYVPPMEAAS